MFKKLIVLVTAMASVSAFGLSFKDADGVQFHSLMCYVIGTDGSAILGSQKYFYASSEVDALARFSTDLFDDEWSSKEGGYTKNHVARTGQADMSYIPVGSVKHIPIKDIICR